MEKEQELKFNRLSWQKGPYFDKEVEEIRAEMIKKNVGLQEMADHMMIHFQHLSSCLRGKYKLTKRNRRFMREYLNSKPELNDVVL